MRDMFAGTDYKEDLLSDPGVGSFTAQGSHLTPSFDPSRCKRCGLCGYLCPAGALELPPRSAPHLVQPQACRGCRTCELICPDFAVSIAEALPAAGAHPRSAVGGSLLDQRRP
ncbi:MAG: 4Fe-4S binding protein [Thermoleophilia bacterium]|nr:4Fe-4S binding protein [Thermoleophilia bacterium]